MPVIHGFELLREEEVRELGSVARLYRHVKTGAELLSVVNDDENKAFCITFRTPPEDSTGVAHILEHSVLCGSRKYPLKEPFVELIKGSLNTFLNAFTGDAETYYPVASVNKQDFYNLVDVYLDAVFHPRMPEEVFAQEGWHYELEDKNEPVVFRGIVFNEMKGAYASPDTILGDQASRSLFPDHVYGVSSGGEPKHIPDLTYEYFKGFHEKYYHPSNARIWFWGDDDPDERLRLTDEYLKEYDAKPVDSAVPLAPHFTEPKRLTCRYPVGDEDGDDKSMLAMSWVVSDDLDPEFDMAADILRHILAGTAASPLRKALLDSGLVEDAGAGVSDIRQRSFRISAKGVKAEDVDKVEELILSTLKSLVENGISDDAIEASMNTAEFNLRELNTGGFPRGLAVLFSTMSHWLYDADPIAPLKYEAPLAAVKAGVAAGGYFEGMIRDRILNNPHRTTVIVEPDAELAQRETEEERLRLETYRANLADADLDKIIEDTHRLQAIQTTPDTEEALATLPRLTLGDLDPNAKKTPNTLVDLASAPAYYHDLFTNGIIYADIGFDLRGVPEDLLSYLPLFSRSLLQQGTQSEDYVTLTQRIGRKTGGIRHELLVSNQRGSSEAVAKLMLRSKATASQVPDLIAILGDILLTARLDNRERFKQMVLEEKVRLESSLVPSGHGFVSRRLGSRFTEAGWIGENLSGVSYLFFIRDLAARLESDWNGVLDNLERLRQLIIRQGGAVSNVTVDQANFDALKPQLTGLFASLPAGTSARETWHPGAERVPEGLTIPGQVNHVGKAARLSEGGYTAHGSALVISNYLRTSWLWQKVRMEGGAYGGFCGYDVISGVFSFGSYRDPNLQGTLANFDGSAPFLREVSLSEAELTRTVIGTIGDLDSYQLPDAKGYSQFVRELIGETDDLRQRRRDEVLGTTVKDFREFAGALDHVARDGDIVVVGSAEKIEAANQSKPGWFKVTKVM
jgi:hypothetical protein